MHTLADPRAFAVDALKGIVPPPRILPSEWADANVHLTSKSSAKPGPYRIAKTPYMEEPLNRMAVHSLADRLVLMFGGQLAKTQLLLNALGYRICLDPVPMILVQPNVHPMLETFVRQRLDPMIESCPELSRLVSSPRTRDGGNTMDRKEFPGGILALRGAQSPAGLRSMPAALILLDEVDSYPGDLDGEGDPVDLALRASATFSGRRKLIAASTPTIKGQSRIENLYLESDQRHFYVPLACGHYQRLYWTDPDTKEPRVYWPKGKPQEAKYRCRECDRLSEHWQKTEFLAGGEWRPDRTDWTGWDGRTFGYQLSSLYSPVGLGQSWAELAQRWDSCHDDPPRLQVFVNTVLGETYEDRSGEGAEADTLCKPERLEDWTDDTVPDFVTTVTAGADTMDDWGAVEIVGWGPAYESASLGYYKIDLPPWDPDYWDELDGHLRKTFKRKDGTFLKVDAACIDAGGHMAQHVFGYVRGCRKGRCIWAVRGEEKGDVWSLDKGTSTKHRARYYRVGVSKCKATLYNYLRLTKPGPGYCHFPTGRDPSWFDGLASERLVKKTDRHGRTSTAWVVDPGVENEPLDCRNYAYAAVCGLVSMKGRRLDKDPVDHARDGGPTLRGRIERPFSNRQPDEQVVSRDTREFAPDEWGDDGW